MPKIEFNSDISKYNEWADALYKTGYRTPLKKMIATLGVSRNWMYDHILSNYPYVRYEYAYTKAKSMPYDIYINGADVADHIMKNAEFSYKSKVIDVMDILNTSPKLKKKVEPVIKKCNRKRNDFQKGIIHNEILNTINDLYGCKLYNLNYRDRSLYPWHKIEPFDIFKGGRIIVPKDKTSELYYREAVLRGYIKIAIGTRKILYYDPEYKCEMPLAIRYGNMIHIDTSERIFG